MNYIELEWGAKAAYDFQTNIDYTISVLKTHPYIGSPSFKYPGLRGISITHHNRLYYRIDGNTIFVMFLADTRRKNYET